VSQSNQGDRKKDIKRFSRHRLKQQNLLDFVELRGFTDDWHDLKLDEEALTALQFAIISNPKAGAVVSGTGGLRKIRFAPAAWGTGRRVPR
jgi:hypothetical protein